MAKYNQGGGYNADKDNRNKPVDEMPQSPWQSANIGFSNYGYNSNTPAFGQWSTQRDRASQGYQRGYKKGQALRAKHNQAFKGFLGWMGKLGKGALGKLKRNEQTRMENPQSKEDVRQNAMDSLGIDLPPLPKDMGMDGKGPYGPDGPPGNLVEDKRNFLQKAWDNKGYSRKDKAASGQKAQSIMENIQRKNFAREGLDYDDQNSYDHAAELDRFNEESEMARNNEVYTAGGDKESWDPNMQMDADMGTSEEDYYMEEVKDKSAAGLLRKLMPGGNKGTKMVERSDGSTEEDGHSMTEGEYARLNQDYSGDSQTEGEWRQDQIQNINDTATSSEGPQIRRPESTLKSQYAPEAIEPKEMKRNLFQKAMSKIKQKMNDKKVAKWQEGMPDREFKDDFDANEPYEQGDSSSDYDYDADYSGESSEPFVSEENQPGFEDRDLAAELSQGKITREQFMKLKKKQAHFKYQDVEDIDTEPNLMDMAMKNSRRA